METNHYERTGRNMFLITWAFVFALLFGFFHFYKSEDQGHYEIKAGVLTIHADAQGHYPVEGYINQVPVKFMVDTGATFVAIPQKLATQLNLYGRYPVTLKTANGEVVGSLTCLPALSFGKFMLTNVKAIIIPGDEDSTVLLGMNVLGQFNLSQQDKKLIIKK